MRTLGGGGEGGRHDGLYAEGIINDQACKLLIDTGSSVSIVTTQTINERNFIISESPFKQLRTPTGEVTPIHGCTTVDIAIGPYRGKHMVLVADIVDSCILGLNFLQQYECKRDIAGRVLQVQGIHVKLLPGVAQSGPICQRIVAMELLEIKAGEDTVIPATLPGDGYHFGFGIIESNGERNMADGLILGRTLVDLETDILPVRIANVTSDTLKIAPGTWIANCHAVDYVQPRQPIAPVRESASLPEHLSNVYSRSTEGLDSKQQQEVHDLGYCLSFRMYSQPHPMTWDGRVLRNIVLTPVIHSQLGNLPGDYRYASRQRLMPLSGTCYIMV